jgi:LacI family transcriptional regulator
MNPSAPSGLGTSSACTLYDVAREAGVSTATVSRVVHGQQRVSPATRERVLAVIDALGYVPDSAAQSMALRRKEVIGLVAIEPRSPETEIEHEGLLFIEEVLRGVETSLTRIDWSVLISIRRATDTTDAFRWLQKISAKVDGLLIVEGIDSGHHLARLATRTPIVLVSGSPDEPYADVVGADNRAGSTALLRHLIEEHGTTRLFYVSGPPEAPDARERRSAFDEALAMHPGVRLAGFFEGRFATISGQLAVREILTRPRRELPDAIVCANDQMAIGAMLELRAAGIRVPADVAVVGFDNISLGALFSPSLTTVDQPTRLLGERACALLLERIAEPARPRRVERLPTRLVVRESCGCPGAPTSVPGRSNLLLSRTAACSTRSVLVFTRRTAWRYRPWRCGHADLDDERHPWLRGDRGPWRGIRPDGAEPQHRLPVWRGLQVAGRRRTTGNDEELDRQPQRGDRADDAGGAGPRRRCGAGDAIRHLRDGPELDGDLRLRHRGQDPEEVVPVRHLPSCWQLLAFYHEVSNCDEGTRPCRRAQIGS